MCKSGRAARLNSMQQQQQAQQAAQQAPAPAPAAPVPPAQVQETEGMTEQERLELARKKGRSGLRIDLSMGGTGGGSGLNIPQG